MDKKNVDLMLRWIHQREAIRVRKEAGAEHLTDDPILKKYRFCNVRREDDRVTIWIRENIRERFADHPHLWFMLCCARQINWPGTLATLIGEAEEGDNPCWPSHPHFTPKRLGMELERMAEGGYKVFTGAYNITAPPIKGTKKTTFVAEHTLGNLWNNASSIEAMLRGSLLTLKRMHSTIMCYDCWGPFMAYQAVVDMRFTSLLDKAIDINDWAAAGPGTLRGLNRMAGRTVTASLSQSQALGEMIKIAKLIRNETRISFDFSDVPNIMCESDKYIRLINGEGTVRAKYVPGRGS